MENLPQEQRKQRLIQSKPSEKGEIITYLSRMGDVLHYVEERGEVVILQLVTVHAVIDCNKAYLLLGEQNLGIKADLKIVSAETAHILDDNRADFPGFGFCKHCLKSGTVEVTPCVTVIFQKIVCKKFVILKIHINCNLCYSIEK